MILVTGKKGFIGSKVKGTEFKGRITYPSLWIQSIGVKGIVNLAAVGNKKLCEENPEKCICSNLLALNDILKVALARKIWVLHISTFQIKERNLYGLSKLMGEELCRLYKTKGLDVKVVRLPIVYGVGDKPHKVVTKIVNQILNGEEPTINTDETFYFAYVDDVAKVIENEINIMNGKIGEPINLRSLVAGIKELINESNNIHDRG